MSIFMNKEQNISQNKAANPINKQEKQIIKALEKYLIERYLLKEDFESFSNFKIVDYQKFKHGVRITGYNNQFTKMFYGNDQSDITLEKINNSLIRLKNTKSKLYESLKLLWGKPIEFYQCHRSTVYRRLSKALLFIAIDTGLIKQ